MRMKESFAPTFPRDTSASIALDHSSSIGKVLWM
jgi:hypothetical protein